MSSLNSPTILDQDEFQFQVRSCSDKRSTASSTTCSSDRNINFSFHYVKPAHLCAYADEIFLNGQIRPLHSQPFEAVTVYAPFPHAERINVHEILEHCDTSSSAPSQYTHAHYHRYHASPSHSSCTSSEPAHATLHYHRERPAICYTFSAPNTPSHTSPSHSHSSLAHTHHHHSHHSSPSQTHHHTSSTARATTNHTSSTARATTHPHHHATTPSLEPARATSYIPIAAKCRRALRLFRLCRVSHVESSCPPSRESFTPHKLKDSKFDRSAKSTTHLSNMTKLFRPQYDVGINKLQGRKCHLKEAPPLNIPSRVHPIVHSLPSPHAIHYHAQRAHKESMKNRTPSPYGSGLLGCISY